MSEDVRTHSWIGRTDNRWTIAAGDARTLVQIERAVLGVSHAVTGRVYEAIADVFAVATEDIRQALKAAHLTGDTAVSGDVAVVCSSGISGSRGYVRSGSIWSIRAMDRGRLYVVTLGHRDHDDGTPQLVYNRLFAPQRDDASATGR